jgi:hypothetical protein
MKRKIIFFVMLLALTSIVTMQSCKKEDPILPKAYEAAMPQTPAPASSAVVAFTGTGQKINLSWVGTATNAIKWDVYFGTASHPPLAASNVSTNAYTATITAGGKYYWQVETTDVNNVNTISPVWSFQVNSNPGVPALTVPANNAINVSSTAAMTWTCTDPESDALTYDVYLGTTATPAAVASGLTAASYTPALAYTTTYYWKVVAKDPYGGSATSAVGSFTTGAAPADPIVKFVGNYNCDEPAEAYNYGVSFTKVSSTVIKTTNYWNSGWTGNFTLDLTNLTYSMPFTTFQTGWTGIESGYINMTTGKMVGSYTIWQNGVISEQGVHTYTKL